MSDTEKTTVMAINRRTAGPSHLCDNKYLFMVPLPLPHIGCALINQVLSSLCLLSNLRIIGTCMCTVFRKVSLTNSGHVLTICIEGDHPPLLQCQYVIDRKYNLFWLNSFHVQGTIIYVFQRSKVTFLRIQNVGKLLTLTFHQKIYKLPLPNICRKSGGDVK